MKKIKINSSFSGKIFFTSDLHLNHKNVIKYCNRPFSSIKEMNQKLIKNWNSVISENDIVFILGDFCFGNKSDYRYFLHKLNGKKYLIRGNHDSEKNIPNECFEGVHDLVQLHVAGDKNVMILCHYCLLTWNGSYHDSKMLFGHSHTNSTKTLTNQPKNSYDVGVDNNNFTPISYDAIKEIFKKDISNSSYKKSSFFSILKSLWKR